MIHVRFKKKGLHMRKIICVFSCCVMSLVANAGVATWKTTVTDVMVDSTEYGGCMAKLSSGPADNGLPTCNNNWVSMDCFANFYSKSDSANKLSVAQLGYVTGKPVRLRVRDTYTYNRFYCVVERMDSAQ